MTTDTQTLTDRIDAALKATEGLGKPAPVDHCIECGSGQNTTILQKYTNGTARWHSFCSSCYQRVDLGSADVSDHLDLRVLLTEAQAQLRAQAEALARVEEASTALLDAYWKNYGKPDWEFIASRDGRTGRQHIPQVWIDLRAALEARQ